MTEQATIEAGSLAARPDHVPANLVHDFDLLTDPALTIDPHGRYERLMAEAPPIFWTPRNGGHWMLNRFELTFDAARDWETFSSQPEYFSMTDYAAQSGPDRTPLPIPILIDPPMHGKFRAPLNRIFAPKALGDLSMKIRALAIDLIDQVAGDGRCEFMRAIGEPLPVQIFLRLMGLPVENQAEYRDLVDRQMSSAEDDHEGSQRILREMGHVMKDAILDRRQNPKDDLISALWAIEIDGAPVTLEQVEDYCVLLFSGGLDTVMNALGFGVRHMAIDQGFQARLRASPELIPEAVEELLRRYAFLQGVRRVARDVEFHGVQLRYGEHVLLNLAGAHSDPRHWDNPTEVDLDREDKAHITFSAGPHRCVGSHLARIELRTVYEEFLRRIPTFHLDESKPARFRGGKVLGVRHLDIVWSS